jgi:hypothetical protein
VETYKNAALADSHRLAPAVLLARFAPAAFVVRKGREHVAKCAAQLIKRVRIPIMAFAFANPA